jgi:hypothetical protein
MGSVSTPGIPHWPDEPVHEVIAFVLPQAEMDLAPLAEHLRERFPGAGVGTHGRGGQLDQVAVYADGWMVRVYLQEGDDALADSRDMAADAFADHPRAKEMGECRRRVDVLVADPTVSVAAFDCLDTTREWLKAQPGVIVIHP